ncbi:SusC/RagA family TonB-linked outer membrane protein [Pedobacter panaciterrae]
MRLTTVILIASLMQVSAATFGQRVTLNKANASLFSVLKDIRKQTGYGFYYDPATISQSQKVSIAVADATVEEALSSALKGLNLVYEIDGKIVTIKAREKPSFLENVIARFQEIDVSGRVVDADGRGLPGASVSIKGKGGKAVSTGANGSFYLKGVDEDAVLVISFIGYVSKEVKAVKELGDIVLEQSLSKLDEVQVIAYGTTTQRLSTGNVTTIKADVIEKQPVNNPLLALQGRVPGLFIEQATGFAGTGVKVRIQGQNSMINGSEPLYVVDGMAYSSQLIPGGNSILGFSEKGAGNPLNFINPLDIESIDVLKDADATSIYGSRAANGAILITTKKGKAGDVKVDVNLQNGWGKVIRRLDLMNSQQYLDMRREAFKNDGIDLTAPPYNSDLYKHLVYPDISGFWDNTRNTDWQKELIGGTSQYTDLNASVSGGNSMSTFLIGANYHKEGNVFPGNFADTRGSVHFSANSTSKNQKFEMQFSGLYLADNNLLPNADLTQFATTLAPVAPTLFNADRSLNWQLDDSGASTFFNPLSYIYSKNENKTNNLIGNGILSYRFFEEFKFKTNFGYSNLLSNSLSYSTMDAVEPANRSLTPRATNFGTSKTDSWSIEPQISFNSSIGKGKFDVLLGTTILRENRQSSTILAEGFSTDLVMEDIKSATSLSSSSSLNSVYRYNALFGRINYNFEDKYIVNLTARRDGSSRFGSKNLFHNFGAAGFAWIFSKEKLFAESLGFLSFGKLRGSYGTTGNDKIPDYNFLSLYNVVKVTNPYQGTNGYAPTRLTNPYLQWEETRKLQIGLDLGFFKDRILLNMNYSNNISSNQLLSFALPNQTGFDDIQSNFPATVKNTGFELQVFTRNLISSAFSWSSSFNLTLPKNKLIKFMDIEKSPYASQYIIGESINIEKKYQFAGVDPTTGVYQFMGADGRLKIDPVAASASSNNDQFVLINPDPKFYGGFQNTFKYRGFQLDVLFQFTKQNARNYLFGAPSPAGSINGAFNNEPSWQIDRWQKTGDNSAFQKYSSGFDLYNSLSNAVNYSNANFGNASYIRLKNLSFSWELTRKWIESIEVQKCKLFLQVQNLLTITNYLGLDPETKSSSSLPPLRVITLGMQIGL